MLIWVIWMTLCLEFDSLRSSLLMAPTSLSFIYLYADCVRELAWHILLLIWPQWILNFMVWNLSLLFTLYRTSAMKI
jgi:hypothetical protein